LKASPKKFVIVQIVGQKSSSKKIKKVLKNPLTKGVLSVIINTTKKERGKQKCLKQ
jgi:hypothetical protein